MSKDFYVYLHRKATTGEVFYVGKGQDDRGWETTTGRNKYWHNVVRKHGFYVEIVISGVQEWYAFEVEFNMIALYGREDTGHGNLVNMTDGGQGESGRHTPESTRQKISKANSGKIASKETREKMSASQKGRKHTEQTKLKMSESGKKRSPDTFGFRPKVAVVRDNSVVYEGSKLAEQLLICEGLRTANNSNIVGCCNGRHKSCAGSVWRYATPEETAALKEKGASWAPLSELFA